MALFYTQLCLWWTDSYGEVALNPASKTTPVIVVFNSSQIFRGHSLNDSWELGPHVMNNLHGMLLRFRKDKVAAQGDIRKMYYMVRVTKEETMIQLFIWKFSGEDKLRTFRMKRLVMGNKPSSAILLSHSKKQLNSLITKKSIQSLSMLSPMTVMLTMSS